MWNLATVLAAIVIPYTLNHFAITDTGPWWSVSIGAVAVLLLFNLLSRTKTGIHIQDDNVTLYHSGMVQGNVPMRSVRRVSAAGKGHDRRLEIQTTDELRFPVPVACFSEEQISEIVARLAGAGRESHDVNTL
jgi:hypothetical protein